MSKLTSRQEAFCHAYAAEPNGAAAARAAGYSVRNAAAQASRLLLLPDVTGRIAELNADDAERRLALAAQREAESRALAAELQPVYEATLNHNDYDGALQTVELKGRIRGFIDGGATIKPRGPRPVIEDDPVTRVSTPEQFDELMKFVDVSLATVQRLVTTVERLEDILAATVDLVDPKQTTGLHRRFYEIDGLESEERDDDDGYGNEMPMKANESQ